MKPHSLVRIVVVRIVLFTGFALAQIGGVAMAASAPVKVINYSIALNASPGAGGRVSGDGMFAGGSARTVTATANSGYVFAGWAEGGKTVSTSPNFSFTLAANRSLMAMFTPVARAPVPVPAAPTAAQQAVLQAQSAAQAQAQAAAQAAAQAQAQAQATFQAQQRAQAEAVNAAAKKAADDTAKKAAADAAQLAALRAQAAAQAQLDAQRKAQQEAQQQQAQAQAQAAAKAQAAAQAQSQQRAQADAANAAAKKAVDDAAKKAADDAARKMIAATAAANKGAADKAAAEQAKTMAAKAIAEKAAGDQAKVIATPAAADNRTAGTTPAVVPPKIVNYAITLNASSSTGGRVSGEGSFANGSTRTITATVGSGYVFGGWVEGGKTVSTSPSYTFTLTTNRSLMATFSVLNYAVTISASPSTGGRVSGDGTFASGTTRTITAAANTGYLFGGWTEGGKTVSTSASYAFPLTANRSLAAIFTPITLTNGTIAPAGIVDSRMAVTTPAQTTGFKLPEWLKVSKAGDALISVVAHVSEKHKLPLRLESHVDTKFGRLSVAEYKIAPDASIDLRGVAGTLKILEKVEAASTLYSIYSNAKSEFASRGISASSLINAWKSGPQSIVFAFDNPDAGIKALTEGFTSASAVSIRFATCGIVEVYGPDVERFVNKIAK